MVSKLQTELKQTKPFKSLEEEVILNIFYTAERLASASGEVLKALELTGTQYNVLRILRGAGKDGLMCGEISERMVTKESDITRLLDRVEARGFISRERPASNRRVVIARITEEGLKILKELDAPVDKMNKSLIGHLGDKKLATLVRLLEEARNRD